jgi:hypothetical protein
MNTGRRDPRKSLCDDLAREISKESGARLSAWLRFTEAFGGPQEPPADLPSATAEAAEALARKYLEGEPAPIGIWRPSKDGDTVAFVRDASPLTEGWWAPSERLVPKRSLLPLRVVLVGESTAAGWFYAPALTPAKILEAQLRAARGPRSFEVIDLTMVNLQAGALLDLLGASLQLTPDVIVLFAGNNWPLRLLSTDSLSPGDAREAALAFREDGMRGLVRFADDRSRETARRAAEIAARLGEAAGVPLVVVVPEANLSDWRRDRPVPWLPGASASEWHRLYRVADRDIGAARRMLELDSGVSSASYRLLARGLERTGDSASARDAYLSALDRRSWDNIPSMPSATTGVREALRASDRFGATVVDLPEIFRSHLGSRIPGRELFLDYCHLTVEGMRVAMAGVGARVLELSDPAAGEDWRSLLALEALDPPAPSLDGTAKIMTALYNAHYGSGHDPGAGNLVRHWLREAESAWSGARGLMKAYIATRFGGTLDAHQQRWHRLLGDLTREAAMNSGLDPEVVEILREHLGSRELAMDLPEGKTVDLSQPDFHWSVSDRYQEEPGSPRSLHYRARWPSSQFGLPASGKRPISLEATLRLPRVRRERAGDAELRLNGKSVARFRVSTSWARHRVELPASDLHPGFNRITLEWPPLPEEGDEALVEIGRRLEEGIAADLHPRFGEIYAFRART